MMENGQFGSAWRGAIVDIMSLIFQLNAHIQLNICIVYPLSYGVPVRERYGSTLLPATREQHDQNCTQSH